MQKNGGWDTLKILKSDVFSSSSSNNPYTFNVRTLRFLASLIFFKVWWSLYFLSSVQQFQFRRCLTDYLNIWFYRPVPE